MSALHNRSVSALFTSVSAVLLVFLFGVNCAAMLYKPSAGRFKDGFILRHAGQFYLFSMYTPGDEANFRNVWLATSRDGVHWTHVGPVIKDAPFPIWAMSVHKVGDKFIMNHGSFTRPGVQNVLRFWESKDLVRWTFLGHEADLRPDPRWYPPDSRLDCMSVVPVVANGRTKYYGYATGPGGFLESEDGLHWSGRPQPQVDWNTVPPPPTPKDEGGFEVGGCHQIGGKYYLVGGWFNYMGFTGYGVYTLIGDTPVGPFHADAAAYRLCGNSTRWVALWARFCPTDADLLVNGYMYSGYTYETGETWLPPLKRAVVDAGGHLRLGYWKGNDALQGTPLNVDLGKFRKAHPEEAQADCSCKLLAANRLELQAQPERDSIVRTHVPTTVAVLDSELDFNRGVVLTGTIQATCRNPRLVASSVGLYLEEKPGEGTAILLHSYGRTEIGKLTFSDGLVFHAEDVVGPGCAAPAGIVPHTNHTFRLLVRKNMFELYLDDMFVQTFNTTHEPGGIGVTPRRVGFIAQNGQGLFENVRAWSMTLDK
jgi:hypothetical protein